MDVGNGDDISCFAIFVTLVDNIRLFLETLYIKVHLYYRRVFSFQCVELVFNYLLNYIAPSSGKWQSI